MVPQSLHFRLLPQAYSRTGHLLQGAPRAPQTLPKLCTGCGSCASVGWGRSSRGLCPGGVSVGSGPGPS